MKTQLKKWGNSLAVRIPRPVVQGAKLRHGDRLEVTVTGAGAVEIRTVRRKLTLAQLVRSITPENRHAEADWGRRRGAELW